MTGKSPQKEAFGPKGSWSIPPLPYVSVIVPARNEEGVIGQTLAGLLEQDYDPERFEILVADGHSTDGTCAIIRSLEEQHENLHLLHNERRWSSAGRNLAVQNARGEILVVVDCHCDIPGRDYLRKLVDAFQRSGADCVGRPQPLEIAGANRWQRTVALARSSWLGHHPESYIYSGQEQMVRPQSVAVAYRREVFETIGLFDDSFDACEDVEFNHRVERAGMTCFFTPRVAVPYHPRASLWGLFRQMVRYGRGRVRLLRKHPDTFSLGSLAPALFLLGLAAGSVLAWFSSWLAIAYAGALGCYLTTVTLASLYLSWKHREASLLFMLPLAFAAIHGGAGSGLLWELAFGQTQVRARPSREVFEKRSDSRWRTAA